MRRRRLNHKKNKNSSIELPDYCAILTVVPEKYHENNMCFFTACSVFSADIVSIGVQCMQKAGIRQVCCKQ